MPEILGLVDKGRKACKTTFTTKTLHWNLSNMLTWRDWKHVDFNWTCVKADDIIIEQPCVWIIFWLVTWEHSELGICPRPGAARVIGQTAVHGWVWWLNAADLEWAGWQHRQTGVRVKGHGEVFPVLLPADDGYWLTGDLAAQQGSVAKVRGNRLGGDNHLQWTWRSRDGEKFMTKQKSRLNRQMHWANVKETVLYRTLLFCDEQESSKLYLTQQ